MFVKDEKDLKEVNIKETKNEIVDKTDKIDVKGDKKDKSYTEQECLIGRSVFSHFFKSF